MKKKNKESIVITVLSVHFRTVARESSRCRSFNMLVLYGCLSMLLACAAGNLTTGQKAEFNEAILQDPDNALNYWKRASAYHQIKQYWKAIEDYSCALELDPNNAKVYNSRGSCYFNLKLYWKANRDFTSSIELDPSYAHAYYNRANSLGALDYRNDACEDMSEACKLYTQQGNQRWAKSACYSVERNCSN